MNENNQQKINLSNVEKFEQHVRDRSYEMTDNLFLGRTANEWLEIARNKVSPAKLFGKLWYENEICILYADTNLGKSILAMQIGDSISRGEPIPGFEMETTRQTVLYLDFELTDKQFENRYSDNYANHYAFDDNFLRAEIDPDVDYGDLSFEEFMYRSLEEVVIYTGGKILIVDNITYLKNDTERAKDALPLMKQLKALKTKYNLSILALAHTPKRDMSKPLSGNDLQGSKMLLNFCDSAFALGESTIDKSYRYLKQIKARNCGIEYDTDNVGVFEIVKPHNYLHFKFVGHAHEYEHLQTPKIEEQNELEQKISDMLRENPEATGYSIAKTLCPPGKKLDSFNVKVARIIKRLKSNQESGVRDQE